MFFTAKSGLPDPSMCVSGPNGVMLFEWDYQLVTLSVAIAMGGSFAALECAQRMRTAERAGQRRLFFWLGAVLMGLAIWTMHFVGMLALRMPMSVSYASGWSVLSIVAASVGAGLAFWIMARRQVTFFHIALGGIAMGVAIASMHYLGMASMRMGAVIDYEPRRFLLSIAIAIAASSGALAISHAIPKTDRRAYWMKGGSAIVMGLAIAGMHYMGMAAARYTASSVTANADPEPRVGRFYLRDVVQLAGLVFAGALVGLTARSAVERQRALEAYRQLAGELEQRVRERTAELEASNRELSAFSYSVSHDLRSPLRSIAGFSEALGESCAGKLDEASEHYLRRILAAVRRMEDLINGLLRLSHISQAKLRHEDVDLAQLARAIVSDLAAQEPGRSVEVEIAEPLQARGDRALLTSLVQNLLGNAWKFTAHQPSARIEFTATREGDKTVFLVRDNGVGFNMQHADKLFLMFERLHAQADFPGYGIGLALAHRVIERHGGKIWAESKVGHGATFYFTLG